MRTGYKASLIQHAPHNRFHVKEKYRVLNRMIVFNLSYVAVCDRNVGTAPTKLLKSLPCRGVAKPGRVRYKKCAFHDAGRVFPSSVTNTEHPVLLFERYPIEGSVASSFWRILANR